jgi:hypothetical protein
MVHVTEIPPAPTRGPNKLPTFKENSRVLAGLDDGHRT